MLDMGFEPQIREVMQNLKQRHQTLLFSATMPVEIEDMAGTYLSNPIRVKASQLCCVRWIMGMQEWTIVRQGVGARDSRLSQGAADMT